MKYKDIKTPKRLLKCMDKFIKYGFVDNNEKMVFFQSRKVN